MFRMNRVSRFVLACDCLTHGACSLTFHTSTRMGVPPISWRRCFHSANRPFSTKEGTRIAEITHLAGITMQFRRPSHASVVLILAASICSAVSVGAQTLCDAATVRGLAAVSVTELASPDLYFNVQTGLPPVVGLAQLEALRVKHANERKNEKPQVFTILQVDAAPDGSMAYDDGSVHVEFDNAKTGKHVAYDLSYLRVWKVVGGKCATAAMYGRRGDRER